MSVLRLPHRSDAGESRFRGRVAFINRRVRGGHFLRPLRNNRSSVLAPGTRPGKVSPRLNTHPRIKVKAHGSDRPLRGMTTTCRRAWPFPTGLSALAGLALSTSILLAAEPALPPAQASVLPWIVVGLGIAVVLIGFFMSRRRTADPPATLLAPIQTTHTPPPPPAPAQTRFTQSTSLIPFPPELSRKIVRLLSPRDARITEVLFDAGGKIQVRSSARSDVATLPVEDPFAFAMTLRRGELAKCFAPVSMPNEPSLFGGGIRSMRFVDGISISFDNDREDRVQLSEGAGAEEFHVATESGSQARAYKLCESVVSLLAPGGALRRMFEAAGRPTPPPPSEAAAPTAPKPAATSGWPEESTPATGGDADASFTMLITRADVAAKKTHSEAPGPALHARKILGFTAEEFQDYFRERNAHINPSPANPPTGKVKPPTTSRDLAFAAAVEAHPRRDFLLRVLPSVFRELKERGVDTTFDDLHNIVALVNLTFTDAALRLFPDTNEVVRASTPLSDILGIRCVLISSRVAPGLWPVMEVKAVLTDDQRSLLQMTRDLLTRIQLVCHYPMFAYARRTCVVTSDGDAAAMEAHLAVEGSVVLSAARPRTALSDVLWAMATFQAREPQADPTLVVLRADQVLPEIDVVRKNLDLTASVARKTDAILCIGIAPSQDACRWTECGAMKVGAPYLPAGVGGVYRLADIAPSPGWEKATEMAQEAAWQGIAGLFVFRRSIMERALNALQPDLAALYQQVKTSLAQGDQPGAGRAMAKLQAAIQKDGTEPDPDHSIEDRIIIPLVKATEAAKRSGIDPLVVSGEFRRLDLRTWDDIESVAGSGMIRRDMAGNLILGSSRNRVHLQRVRDCIIYAGGEVELKAENLSGLICAADGAGNLFVGRKHFAKDPTLLVDSVLAAAREKSTNIVREDSSSSIEVRNDGPGIVGLLHLKAGQPGAITVEANGRQILIQGNRGPSPLAPPAKA